MPKVSREMEAKNDTAEGDMDKEHEKEARITPILKDESRCQRLTPRWLVGMK